LYRSPKEGVRIGQAKRAETLVKDTRISARPQGPFAT
jgi:hypothetical protein